MRDFNLQYYNYMKLKHLGLKVSILEPQMTHVLEQGNFFY